MSLRRATTVAVTVSAAVFAVLLSVAVAAAYSGAWMFRRYDEAAYTRMADLARQDGRRVVPPLPVPPPTLREAVTQVTSEVLIAAMLATLALLLVRGGRRWLGVSVGALPLLAAHASFPDLPLLWGQRPDADPRPAVWAARVAWSVAVAAAPVVLTVLAGRTLPRPLDAGRVLARVALPAGVAALLARLVTAPDDRVAAATGAALAVVACGLLATAGYRRPLVAVAGAWASVAIAGLIERYALGSVDAWVATAWLPVAALAVVGAASARGTLGRLWTRLLRHGPRVPARHRATRPAAG
jgi:hypothetical protein